MIKLTQQFLEKDFMLIGSDIKLLPDDDLGSLNS